MDVISRFQDKKSKRLKNVFFSIFSGFWAPKRILGRIFLKNIFFLKNQIQIKSIAEKIKNFQNFIHKSSNNENFDGYIQARNTQNQRHSENNELYSSILWLPLRQKPIFTSGTEFYAHSSRSFGTYLKTFIRLMCCIFQVRY